MKYVKLGYYKKTDWDRLLSIIDDRDKMHSEWEDWHQAYNNLKIELSRKGFEVIKLVVDLDKLINYCKDNNLENTSATRSIFIQSS